MALRADDVQAAELANFLCLRRNLRFVFFIELRKGLAGIQNLFIVRVAVGGSLADELLRELHAAHFGTRHELCVTAEQNIRTTAGHVRCDGHSTLTACLCDDFGFFFMVLCVQHFVLDAAALQHGAELLGFFNRDGTDQHRLAFFVVLDDVVDNGIELALFGLVNNVRAVFTNHRLVCRNLYNVQFVNFAELGFLGHGRAGHAGEFVVKAEEILERDGCKRFAFARDFHAFLRFNGLVQTFVVASAVHQTAGEFINDDDFAVAHDVIDIALHDAVRLDRLIDVVLNGDVVRVREVFQAEELLGFFYAALGERCGLLLFVDDIIVILVDLVIVFLFVRLRHADRAQGLCEAVGDIVKLRGLLALTGNDERGTRLIDEDGVHLVHDGEVMAALHLALFVGDHVVTQVVKADLIVRCVCDVAGVGFFLFVRLHAGDGKAYGETEVVEHTRHHFALIFCKVIVDGDDVNTLAA